MSQCNLFRETVFYGEPNIYQVVNVASVPQRSPFRYPRGKTWLIPIFRHWIASLGFKPEYLIEPFAGGGTFGLTALCEGLTKKILLVELDQEIAAVWRTLVAGDGDWLAKRILSFELTLDNVRSELSVKCKSTKEQAFQTILKNRTYHGGILAEGSGLLKYGENGKGIASRWYPQTLAKRIRNLSLVRHRLEFIEGDGFEVLKKFKTRKDVIFFIDPPYTAGGKKAGSRLYTHSEIDHPQLFKACAHLKGNFLLTYDNAE
jgi:DNA adenine methylase